MENNSGLDLFHKGLETQTCSGVVQNRYRPITVYKASAGTGKTFTLATRYIKLLIDNPDNFRNILAVTFTNKATEEMKMRILSQLYGIAHHLPDSEEYLNKVIEMTGATEEYIASQAKVALSNLVHNYSYFRVETIDTFFQSILRNLARELDLTANLRIELNDRQIEQQAVDTLIEELVPASKELGWIMSYIRENISDDKSWNIIGLLKRFGENIFKDFYRQNEGELTEKLKQKGFFKEYTDKLRAVRDKAKDNLLTIAETFFDILSANGIDIADFNYGKSGVCGYFIKLRNGVFEDNELLKTRVTDALEEPMNWVKKGDRIQGSPLLNLVQSELLPLLLDAERIRPKQLTLYKSADITLKHLNQLRLLSSIEAKVREMNADSNRFLLSDTQALLSSLIDESDSPFIFEKIGTQLHHVMIDEFQDTSTIQWRNFKVLLDECMSHEDTENLIVGDVKQSIYRWRSGDWRLLNDIEKEFPTADTSTMIERLDVNYRSEANVVNFNNAFFKAAANWEYRKVEEDNAAEAGQLNRAYADVEQKLPAGKPTKGYVHIELLPQKDYHDKMMVHLKEAVEELIEHHVPLNKIAIIIRSNGIIQEVADYFMREMPDVRLVSDEAFRLDASLAVNIIIDALHVLMHPNDRLAIANLAKAYCKVTSGSVYSESTMIGDREDMTALLPKDFSNYTDSLVRLPLRDLVEKLYIIFNLGSLQHEDAYLCSFYDQLNSYISDNVSDIDSFVEYWNETIHSKTIAGDEIDGIRLITIHKSKGLEFEHVIMPFCDWQLEKVSTIWCKPTEAPFDELPLVPIDFVAKQMRSTIYEQDYLHEHLQNVVDNLNLLYVAFTRAKCSLQVFGKRGKSGIRTELIETCLPILADTLEKCVLVGDIENAEEIVSLEYGSLEDYSQSNKKTNISRNVFKQPIDTENIDIVSFDMNVEFRQSNKSRSFIENVEEEEETLPDYVKIGSILHNVLSNIRTAADINLALTELEKEGVLYDHNLTQEKLITMLRERLKDKRVEDWFSDRWTIFNECSIVHLDGSNDRVVEHRPDRVLTDGKEMIVIDFKFAAQREEHHAQVRQYMALLRDMGYRNVSGYLWYVYSNIISEVR